MTLIRIKQYWLNHVILSVLLIAISCLMLYMMRESIEALPRNSIPFLATVFSTLLGLTFTTFAIFTAFMPNLRKDFVGTNTFLNEGRTFRFTIYLEILTLLLTFLDYIIFGSPAFDFTIFVTVILVIWSIGFFYFLVENTFRLFKSVREQIKKGG